jgi:nicotinamidase-related amidase
MIAESEEQFLQISAGRLTELYGAVASSTPVSLSELNPGQTALIIIDMINGFVKKGALSSPNILEINAEVARLLKTCNSRKIKAVCFADCHTKESPEFSSYPVHCLAGTDENCVTSEIAAGNYTLIQKNSTNGFLEPAFAQWLIDNRGIDTFVVAGCCTDICIQQFALTLKSDFNRRNARSRVIVPVMLSATYDTPGHDATLIDLVSFYNMMTNGVEVTAKFEY